MTAQPVLRFAPSPNGELHLGHAYSALVTRDIADRLGGRLLLRIEDIDRERCRPEYEAAILEDLAWLGLDWEQPVRRQSAHFDIYRAALAKLDALGLLYPCFASRKEIQAAVTASADPVLTDPDGAPLYPGLWRDAEAGDIEERTRRGDPYALRLHSARALALLHERGGAPLTFTELDDRGNVEAVTPARPGLWGDVILARKETPASYHLCVVVDDAIQGITHVTRGRDLHAATHMHRLLQVLLDLPEPLYHHHQLVLDASGRKLSKSARDTSLASLRADAHSPGQIIALAQARLATPARGS